MALIGSRRDEYDVTVTVDGVSLGTFDTFAGGEIDSEEVLYKPGGMGSRLALGGSQLIGNITLQKIYDIAQVHSLVHWLATRAGKGSVVVNKQPLDVDGNVFGRPLVYTGKLKKVHPPEPDSQATDAAVLELEVTVMGTVA